MSRSGEPFGYEYFDDPRGLGYRGYYFDRSGDGSLLPWTVAVTLCTQVGARSAVDWGCAKGYLVSELRAAGVDAIGYDVSEYALSFAAGLPCHRRDIRQGQLETVDATFVLGVLLYLEEAELAEVLADLRRHTRRYLLVAGYYAGDEQPVPDPHRTITRTWEWWAERFTQHGFEYAGQTEAFDVWQVGPLPSRGQA